jgi:hypothetical protein
MIASASSSRVSGSAPSTSGTTAMMSCIWAAVTPWYFSHDPFVSRFRVLIAATQSGRSAAGSRCRVPRAAQVRTSDRSR